ncbi:MAG: hypothetical protein EBU73_02170 [Chitinophagia bacterium]|nr:hypothetical protein [Chitinophagia bacterium]
MKKCLIFLTLTGMFFLSFGQRKYANSSVLSAGDWLKISVESSGVYKLAASDLKLAGFSGTISSAQIRLFGNGGRVLPESNADPVTDDLQENAIEIYDGGDGNFDGADYILFYTPGPHHWIRDTSEMGFQFKKNPYSDQTFYFLQIGTAVGKRMVQKTIAPSTGKSIDMFDEHIHHELDSINFLKSGKEWYGEYFSNQPGYIASRDFNLNIPSAASGELFYLKSKVIGSSAEKSNSIAVSVNGKKLFEHLTSPIPGSLISPVASESLMSGKGMLTGNGLTITYQHNGGSINAGSWLDCFDIHFKRKLDMLGQTQLQFRLKNIVSTTAVDFSIINASSTYAVWDISNFSLPQKIKTTSSPNGIGFIDSVNAQNEFIAFDPTKAKNANIVGKISSQNLHQLSAAELIIVTEKTFIEQANRLREYHVKHDGISTLVVDVDQIYNEFSSGSPDPTAIRNFLKMLYDRSRTNNGVKPSYVLLFGSASYKVKEKIGSKNSLVPSYQTDESIDPLLSYVTDDYFAILDDFESITQNKPAPLLDLGIGRLPVRSLEQAKRTIDKIIRYTSNTSIGSWRNNMTLVADDEDYNLHVEDAELHASLIQSSAPQLQENKIYLDAFKQESNAGGSRYPEVNKEVLKDINNGTLIWNYSGHGNSTRLAYEVVLDKELLSQWKNENRLSFFITATCDFAPFDDQSQFSLGEDLLVGRNTGAIGMVTTTRLVFASSNREMNNAFLSSLTTRSSTNVYPTLGRAIQNAKNNTYSNSTDYINARKFTLLADPALKLAMPDNQVKTKSISMEGTSSIADTVKALNKYVVTGEVLSPDGSILSNFNGNIYPVLYDKASEIKTLANDPESKVASFSNYDNILYKGIAKVEAGKFSFVFTVPKDINYSFGKGKLVYYAENGTIDASGVDQSFMVGGIGTAAGDLSGPDLEAYLDTITFKNGDEVGKNTLLYVQLSDPAGINLSTASIGHEITAVLDEQYAQAIVLNEFYQPTSSGKGMIRYPFSGLKEGKHSLQIKVWDVFNNSTTKKLDFFVSSEKTSAIGFFTGFPNPFNAIIHLNAALNLSSLGYNCVLEVFDTNGKGVRRIDHTINQTGSFTMQFEWDGKNQLGANVQSGVYIARLTLRSKEGKIDSKMLKLMKL